MVHWKKNKNLRHLQSRFYQRYIECHTTEERDLNTVIEQLLIIERSGRICGISGADHLGDFKLIILPQYSKNDKGMYEIDNEKTFNVLKRTCNILYNNPNHYGLNADDLSYLWIEGINIPHEYYSSYHFIETEFGKTLREESMLKLLELVNH